MTISHEELTAEGAEDAEPNLLAFLGALGALGASAVNLSSCIRVRLIADWYDAYGGVAVIHQVGRNTCPAAKNALPWPAMSTLKFVAGRDSNLTATVPTGRYLIVDYGREGFDATFTPIGGVELALPSVKNGRFHKASRHAMAACEVHLAQQAAQPADQQATPRI